MGSPERKAGVLNGRDLSDIPKSLFRRYLAMKLLIFYGSVAALLIAAVLALGSPNASSDMHSDSDKDIVETASAAGSFSTLVAAVQAAGLTETLEGEGPFTVFAPTDEAFAKLPDGTVEMLLKPENKDKLVAILTYHVVPGKVTSAEVAGMTSAKTVNGEEITIKAADGKVMVDDATVVKVDIPASNGVIHVIDAVIMPED